MAVLTILVLVAGAGVALLLVCLNGFTRALGRKSSVVTFVGREEPRVPKPQGTSKTLIDFSLRKTPSKDPAIQRVSNGTVALVGVAIALGSRAVDRRAPAGSNDPKGVESGPRTSTRVPGVQPFRSS